MKRKKKLKKKVSDSNKLLIFKAEVYWNKKQKKYFIGAGVPRKWYIGKKKAAVFQKVGDTWLLNFNTSNQCLENFGFNSAF